MEWTVDTWLVHRANDQRSPADAKACQMFLELVRSKHVIAVSPQVWAEYRPLVGGGYGSFAAQWWAKMISVSGKVVRYEAALPKEAAALRQRLRSPLPKPVDCLHGNDAKFVVLAFRTPDRHLISGNTAPGHLSPALAKWIRKHYTVCLHGIAPSAPYHEAHCNCTNPDEC